MNPYSPHRLDPIEEEITPADHTILCSGGTSSNIERLPSRLQRAKRLSPDYRRQLEDQAFEASYLKAELQWHKESKQIFLHFHERMMSIFSLMEDAIADSMTRLHESERRYLSLWNSDQNKTANGEI
ncbi:hypothetical protein N7467_012038 [Penicillium canescens]|jgi:hypothetical protein|nr:hypothetical protein N7467_011889 [Penicillium canescens]KAJ6070719.1 hypothetical protein N7467_012038 [Penicillium canescens]